MAAEAAVSFAVEKLGEAAIQKVAFLQGVEDQLNELKDELLNMYGFLQDAAQKQVTSAGIHKWISDIRDVAQDVEDVIETFNLEIDTPRRSRGLLERCACFLCHVNHLDKLGKDIESIKKRLKKIEASRKRYDIKDLGEGKEPRRPNALAQRGLSPDQKDKHLVGLEEKVDFLIREAILMDDRRGLSIATIVGMGGSGKSTLARELYNHSEVAGRFDRRAWVVVSEEFDLRETVKELMLQLMEPGEDKLHLLQIMKETTEEDLKRMLRLRLLGRRYFIVLDDVWRQENWESLADAFPDEQDKASRVLVTTRIQKVPRTARYAHELKPFDQNTSWRLFLKKSFIDNTDEKCPPELEEIGRKIVEKCGGLPLAITVVGGLLLKQRQSLSGWEKVLKGMDSHLGRSENSVSGILELSYHDLPPQLKSCFLCLGLFEEDAIIRAKKLIQIWIAEGLISKEGGEETMEEVARGYLDELVIRNIVQVEDMNKHDQVKSCHIHDLLRDLSIKKAKEEIGLEILREGINSQGPDKSRHCAIYCSTQAFSSSVSPNNKHLRSFFFHRAGNFDSTPSYNWKSFRLLRVLDFEGFGLESLPESIGELIGLKYLGLRENNLKELPNSLGCLKNLQVLDIAYNDNIKVPNVIWKMDSLRHLYVLSMTLDAPLRLDTLKNLQTLSWILTSECQPNHLIEMTNLRKLDVELGGDIDVREFITSLAKLKNLACLNLGWDINRRITLEGNVALQSVTELELAGPLSALPSVDNFPPNLSHLTLINAKLDEDPMPALEKLPNLLYLNLGVEAYVGREMAISDDGFPRLRVLLIKRLYELRNIELVGEGRGLPELKQFHITKCLYLKSLPKKLMTLLQGVEIRDCPNLEREREE